MKRLYTALSDETGPIIKRVRLISSLEINENEEEIISNSSNSQSEDDDNAIILISDSDSDDESIDVTGDISSTINILISPSLSDDVETIEEDEEINIENNPELIDLTEDESNRHENNSSIDLEECPICLETFSDLQSVGVYLLITECHHVMCTLCSYQLLSASSRCPLCRKTISSTTLMPYCILT